jgi:hypothetical protein
MNPTTSTEILDRIKPVAEASGRFDEIATADDLLRCHTGDVEEDAWYQVGPFETIEGQAVGWVGFYTPDRWLSGSIEADVLHLGDSFEELLLEEVIDQGLDLKLGVEHFRSEEKEFVFRSRVPIGEDDEAAADRLAKVMLAYDACFRELGDLKPQAD